MANIKTRPIIDGSVEVMLDRPRHILLDLNALELIEEKTGKDLMKGDSWKNLKIRDVKVIFWACLLHEDPEVTLEQAGSWITIANISMVIGALGEMMKNIKQGSETDGKNAGNLPIG